MGQSEFEFRISNFEPQNVGKVPTARLNDDLRTLTIRQSLLIAVSDNFKICIANLAINWSDKLSPQFIVD